jgi:hypothetical protein
MARLVELGRATTVGQALPLGSDDPVIAARAVRRALAAAHRRAADVTELVLAASDPGPESVVSGFARRALGPHGSCVRTMSVVDDAREAASLAAYAAKAAATIAGPDTGVVMAVGIDAEGATEAHCLERG